MNWNRFFIYSAGAILLVFALDRFIIAAGNSSLLAFPEPMFGIPLRRAVWIIGGLELVVAIICLFRKNTDIQPVLLAVFATSFVGLQIGSFWMDEHPAIFIGSLTDPLRISRGTMGFLIHLLPVYLLAGSYATLFLLFLSKRERIVESVAEIPVSVGHSNETFARSIKMACTTCGGHIEFPTKFSGHQIPCPHCQSPVILKKAVNLKISCAACDGHIEFPADALGQTIFCPHCNTSIILKGSA